MKDNMRVARQARFLARCARRLFFERFLGPSCFIPMKTTRVFKRSGLTAIHQTPVNKPTEKVSSHHLSGGRCLLPRQQASSGPHEAVAVRCMQLPARNGRRKGSERIPEVVRKPRKQIQSRRQVRLATPVKRSKDSPRWYTVRVEVAPTEARVVQGRQRRVVLGHTGGGVGPGTWTVLRATVRDVTIRGSQPLVGTGQRVEFPVVGPFLVKWLGVLRHRPAWKLRKQLMAQGHCWWHFPSFMGIKPSQLDNHGRPIVVSQVARNVRSGVRRHAGKVTFWPKPTP